ncbi:MAG: hypothetical protein H0V82_04135 [Candidatus Protochlamydia sp.]|nr:hypothetical protein [Candidatus Protochlamydia sp.]
MVSYINVAPLISCLSNALTVYKGNNFKIPETWQPSVDFKLMERFKNEELNFIHNSGLTKEVYFITCPNNSAMEASGANHSAGSAFIKLTPGLCEVEWMGAKGILKHELTHIINNDPVTLPKIGAVTALACAIIPLTSSLSSLGLALAAPMVAQNIYQMICEVRADTNAIRHSTNEELRGMCRVFKAMLNIENESYASKSVWDRFYSQAWSLTSFCYSCYSLSARIKKLEKELVLREAMIINSQEEAIQISIIEECLRANNVQLEEAQQDSSFMATVIKSYRASQQATRQATIEVLGQ